VFNSFSLLDHVQPNSTGSGVLTPTSFDPDGEGNGCYAGKERDVYVLSPYTLYRLLPIVNAEIRKDEMGVWRFWPDNQRGPLPGYRLETDRSVDPFSCGSVIHFTAVAE
jgi:hypothetical protein